MLSTANSVQAKFVPLCEKYLPGFPVMNIGFSASYSSQFLHIPNVGFNLLQPAAVSPSGRTFIRRLQAQHHQVYTWTVNTPKNMDWCITQCVDGVVTDDVPKFLEVCKMPEEKRKYPWQLKQLMGFAYFNMWIFIFMFVMARRHGAPRGRDQATRKVQ